MGAVATKITLGERYLKSVDRSPSTLVQLCTVSEVGLAAYPTICPTSGGKRCDQVCAVR